jgi:Fur family iron response transcriptional regulator
MRQEAEILRSHGINPSAQRVAIARYVLETRDHPSADEVWTRVRETFPMVSRATVYNTLNLFVAKGLLREFVLTEGRVVFDSNTEDHHHFIDEETGAIHDVAWHAVRVSDVESLPQFDVAEYQVVMRGRVRSETSPTETGQATETAATRGSSGNPSS